jgi:hypothetical protein
MFSGIVWLYAGTLEHFGNTEDLVLKNIPA